MAKVLIPIPRQDFDPTETSIPWLILSQNHHEVVFATPDGKPGVADLRMVDGRGLGPLQMLKANETARSAYSEMIKHPAFLKPKKWDECRADDYQALLLPGGHAPGMREYLESAVLQNLVSEFFKADKPVGAICHGVVLAARSQIAGRSVLYGRKTTALPKWMELSAWGMTGLWLGNYYRTYSKTVEAEVVDALAKRDDFARGPFSSKRDSANSLDLGFSVQDRNYLSARWPGDAHAFGNSLVRMLRK